MIIIAGLGNPGPRYQGNRHNIGFMAADAIARRWSFGPERAKFQSVIREGEVETATGRVKVLLMKPQTFMNESGRAVAEAARFYKVQPSEVIVFHDEIDLAPGRFRMKTGGGAAGQNGVRSLISQLGPDFRASRNWCMAMCSATSTRPTAPGWRRCWTPSPTPCPSPSPAMTTATRPR